MKRKDRLLCVLLLSALLALSGCRVRTTAGRPSDLSASVGAAASQSDDEREAEEAQGEALSSDAGPEGEADPDGQSKENPQAERKEYDERADVEIVQGTERRINEAGEGEAAALAASDAEETANLLNEEAERSATQTLPAEDAEKMGVSEEAAEADSAMTFYTVLLEDRLSTLFECKRLYVYWETEADHVTVYRTSPEHQLILDSGCYDVSARLTEERLQVDDGWVCRKNPDVIVKAVGASVLGSGVQDLGASARVRAALGQRADWQGIGAVREGRIVLLASDMLEAPHLRVLAALVIAKTAYPELFDDVSLDEAARMLTEEATGLNTEAVYFDRGA